MPAAVRTDRPSDGVAVVRLDRPDKRNALDSAALDELLAALDDLAADAGVRAVVISTTDVRGLSAGADVSEVLDDAAALARMAAFTRLYTAVETLGVPTIAVCVGSCVGAGAELATGCDLRVAGDNLKMAWPGARLGVPVGPARLTPLVGLARAKDLILTGRVLGAEEAERIGLVTRVVPAEQAEASAVELAVTLAARPPEGVRVLRRMFGELEDSARRVAYENELLLEFQRTGRGLPRS